MNILPHYRFAALCWFRKSKRKGASLRRGGCCQTCDANPTGKSRQNSLVAKTPVPGASTLPLTVFGLALCCFFCGVSFSDAISQDAKKTRSTWGSNLWRATQLLSLYKVLDREGPLTKDAMWLAAGYPWGIDQPLTSQELKSAVGRLASICLSSNGKPTITTASAISSQHLRSVLASINPQWAFVVDRTPIQNPHSITAGEFALVAYELLK